MKFEVYTFRPNKRGRLVATYSTQICLTSLAHGNILNRLLEEQLIQTKKHIEITKMENEKEVTILEVDNVLTGEPVLNLIGKKV